jgi:formamidopyrimidine-DNA glycosylase
VYRDPRRFGVLDWIDKGKESQHKLLKGLGFEPLEKSWSGETLFKLSRKRIVPVKVFIMDQKILVGVGNIYASEALFRAGVRPTKAAGKVSLAEWMKIESAIRKVLLESIEAGGSSI